MKHGTVSELSVIGGNVQDHTRLCWLGWVGWTLVDKVKERLTRECCDLQNRRIDVGRRPPCRKEWWPLRLGQLWWIQSR